jgi:hypothetical protein
LTKVVFIAGLPGCGKSHFILDNFPSSEFAIFDDFKAGAVSFCLRFPYARGFVELIANLRGKKREAAINCHKKLYFLM